MIGFLVVLNCCLIQIISVEKKYYFQQLNETNQIKCLNRKKQHVARNIHTILYTKKKFQNQNQNGKILTKKN